VSKQRAGSPRARLFIGLELPDAVLQQIVAWQRLELRDEALRPLERPQLHITLAFLGYLPQKEIGRLAALLGEAGRPRVPIELSRDPVARPQKGPPRFFALEARSDRAVTLQSELSARLARARLYRPERRAFWPHLTVARVRSERGKRRPRQVNSPPGPLPSPLLAGFDAVRLTLYRSILRPAGAEYVSLAQVELPPSQAAVR
jgi:RNA 2',3'-cyclic 3'-phosphodiesterase